MLTPAERHAARTARQQKEAKMHGREVPLPPFLQRCDICGRFPRQIDAETWRCPQVFWDASTGAWEHA